MKNWKVYLLNWDNDLYDAIESDSWDFEAETEDEAYEWIDAHRDDLSPDESYEVYHAE